MNVRNMVNFNGFSQCTPGALDPNLPANIKDNWLFKTETHTYLAITVSRVVNRVDWQDFTVICRYRNTETYPSIKGVEVAWDIEINSLGKIINNLGGTLSMVDFVNALNSGLLDRFSGVNPATNKPYFNGPIYDLEQFF